MSFDFRKIANVGTRNQIVARLGVQTAELIQFLVRPEAEREAIKSLYMFTLLDRLVRCERRRDELAAQLRECDDTINKQAVAGRARQVPYVVDLQGICETFLYEAKNFLRDLLQLFQILYRCKLKDGSDFADLPGKGASNVVDWATATFGPDDELTRLLRTEAEWTGRLARMRNAVEHPGEKSGTLHLENVHAHSSGKFVPPTWRLDEGQDADVLTEMSVSIDNMLTLAEDLLAGAIQRESVGVGIIRIAQIPVDKRLADCPVRLQATLQPELLAKLPAGN